MYLEGERGKLFRKSSYRSSKNLSTGQYPIKIIMPLLKRHMCLMDGRDHFDGLEFNEKPVADNQVEAVGGFDGASAINEGEGFLALDRNTGKRELNGEAFLVCAFQQAGPECAMNGQRRVDRFGGKSLNVARNDYLAHTFASLRLCVS